MIKNLYIKIRKCEPFFTTIFNVFFLLAFILLVVNMLTIYMDIPDNGMLGYQPVYIKTGSMEPTIMTDAIILTKQVDSIEELQIGDIITYKVWDETGRELHITHRIYDMSEDGKIITKGDNNRVTDSYTLTIDNVRAKVVWVWNGAATIVNFTKTIQGQIFLVSIVGIFICLSIAWTNLISYLDEKCGIIKIKNELVIEEKEEG